MDEIARPGRAGAGFSEMSWKKHRLFKRLAFAQLSAFRHAHPHSRIAIVDFNAGDGEGIMLEQLDLFETPLSVPTPGLAMTLAQPGDRVILCEKNRIRRNRLQERFPEAIILKHHADAFDALDGCTYILIFSDPCGPAGHGMPHLERIGKAFRYADFIIAHNVGAVNRIRATTSSRWATQRTNVDWMPDWQEWRSRLNRRFIAVGPETYASRGFHYRMLVAANGLASLAKSYRFEVFQ